MFKELIYYFRNARLFFATISSSTSTSTTTSTLTTQSLCFTTTTTGTSGCTSGRKKRRAELSDGSFAEFLPTRVER